MTCLNPTISVFTLNINGLNTSIKNWELLDCMEKKKTQSQPYTITESHFKNNDADKLKRLEKKYHANTNQKN